jgi:Mlc titration factor MtfA (ptsG expression regulator)
MREYIFEKTLNTPRHFKFGGIAVHINDPLPENVSIETVLKTIEKKIPAAYYEDLEGVHIGQHEDFDKRKVNALYVDNKLYISNEQDDMEDILNDVIHEIAHHLETKAIDEIYGDRLIIREFTKKRGQLNFELRSEGYWTEEFDFKDLKFSQSFDDFLYKRVGKQMLRMVTTGIFIRPYAAVSLREYFATGFEAYYLGKQDELFQTSPELYKKISDIDKKTR